MAFKLVRTSTRVSRVTAPRKTMQRFLFLASVLLRLISGAFFESESYYKDLIGEDLLEVSLIPESEWPHTESSDHEVYPISKVFDDDFLKLNFERPSSLEIFKSNSEDEELYFSDFELIHSDDREDSTNSGEGTSCSSIQTEQLNHQESVKRIRLNEEENGKNFAVNLCCKKRNNFIKSELKRLFLNQQPGHSWNLKWFDVLNWPESINIFEKFWSNDQLDIIQENLDKFKFVKRESKKSALDQYGLATEAHSNPNIMKSEWTHSFVLERILQRYREESGDLDALNVRWKHLDRSSIPSMYRDVIINTVSMSTPILFKNADIVDNIHFFRGQISKSAILKRKKRSQNINSIDTEPETCSENKNVAVTVNAKTSLRKKVQKNSTIRTEIRDLFKSKHGNNEPFSFFKYKIINWPVDVDPMSQEWTSEEIEKIRSRINDFIFESILPQNSEQNLTKLQKSVYNSLKKRFTLQHPTGKCSKMFEYNILNWPHGVPKAKEYWSSSICDLIQELVGSFVFSPVENDQINLLKDQKPVNVCKILLDRFRIETGLSEAPSILWSFIDRRYIPLRFRNVLLNSNTVQLPGVCDNLDIINNIHFRNPDLKKTKG